MEKHLNQHHINLLNLLQSAMNMSDMPLFVNLGQESRAKLITFTHAEDGIDNKYIYTTLKNQLRTLKVAEPYSEYSAQFHNQRLKFNIYDVFLQDFGFMCNLHKLMPAVCGWPDIESMRKIFEDAEAIHGFDMGAFGNSVREVTRILGYESIIDWSSYSGGNQLIIAISNKENMLKAANTLSDMDMHAGGINHYHISENVFTYESLTAHVFNSFVKTFVKNMSIPSYDVEFYMTNQSYESYSTNTSNRGTPLFNMSISSKL